MKLKILIFYSLVFIFLFINVAFASNVFVIGAPAKDVFVGEPFSVTIAVSSPDQSMNAVSGTIQIPNIANVLSVDSKSGIISSWLVDPKFNSNRIEFEGFIRDALGYKGSSGSIFNIKMVAKREGLLTLTFTDGAILANDGLGSNIISSLTSKTIKVISNPKVDEIPNNNYIAKTTLPTGKAVALPVITDYSSVVSDKGIAYVKGRGEPNAITKIKFQDSSVKSLGEQFIIALQSKKSTLNDVLLKNNSQGIFEYTSPNNLVAGAYNATPYLVDDQNQTEKPGFGAQILVSDSPLVKRLVVLINILLLLIPIVGLAVLIYFIPWYSRLRMRLVKRRLHLEEEKIHLSEAIVEKQEHLVDKD